MSWDITYHAEEPDYTDIKIGDMWPAMDWANSNIISENYKALKGSRPPLMVMLPSMYCKEGDRFLLDRIAGDAADKHGWTITITGELVSGQKPNITVAPSINSEGSYHGYIRNGTITDDVEGRTYKNIGKKTDKS